jgi:NADH-quinone oxidoreductase subunit J
MSGSELVFYAFAGLAVLSALATVTRKNPVVAAVWLVSAFFSVAVCYVLLEATFLAVIQVLVYAGAMMVLFVFVIMVLDVDEKGAAEHKRPSRIGKIGYYGTVGLGVLFLTWVLGGTQARLYTTSGADLTKQPDFGSANAVGRELFGDYLFAFEAISLLLMAAVVGAVVVARSRKDRERHAEQTGMDETTRHAAGLDAGPNRGLAAVAAGGTLEAGGLAASGPTPEYDFGLPSATGHEGGT